MCPGLVITLGFKHSFSCIYLLLLFSVEIIANKSLSEVVAKLQAEVSYLYIHKQNIINLFLIKIDNSLT